MNANTTPTPLDAKTFAIGILSVTACILLVGFILATLTPSPAYAIGQSDRAGDYLMFTQQLSTSQEGVVVIDAAAQRMSLYAYDYSLRRLNLVHSNFPLDRLPGAARAGGGTPAEEKKP
ncbi:MAG: hypothetical protein U1D55_04450 [Phycisphaerae bacterium]